MNYQPRNDIKPARQDIVASSTHLLAHPNLLMPNRVMTLITNASGVQVAYRGTVT
jgi:hypothetical protein